MIVIADATPLNYLILIDQAEFLPQLFDCIQILPAVFEELQHQETPDVGWRWIESPATGLRRPVRPPQDRRDGLRCVSFDIF